MSVIPDAAFNTEELTLDTEFLSITLEQSACPFWSGVALPTASESYRMLEPGQGCLEVLAVAQAAENFLFSP